MLYLTSVEHALGPPSSTVFLDLGPAMKTIIKPLPLRDRPALAQPHEVTAPIAEVAEELAAKVVAVGER